MKKLIYCSLLAVLWSSYSANALLISVFDSNKDRNAKEVQAASMFGAIGGLGIIVLGGPIGVIGGGISLTIGAVLDGDMVNAKIAPVDPVKHLEELTVSGVYTEAEAAVIEDEIGSMKVAQEAKLRMLGCDSSAVTCNVSAESFQQAFGLSSLTISFLQSIKGVQN